MEGNEHLFVKGSISAAKNGLISELENAESGLFVVLYNIAIFQDRNGDAFPSQSTIAKLSGINRTNANQKIKKLCDFRTSDGYPVLEKRTERKGKNKTVTFYKLLPASGLSFGTPETDVNPTPEEKETSNIVHLNENKQVDADTGEIVTPDVADEDNEPMSEAHSNVFPFSNSNSPERTESDTVDAHGRTDAGTDKKTKNKPAPYGDGTSKKLISYQFNDSNYSKNDDETQGLHGNSYEKYNEVDDVESGAITKAIVKEGRGQKAQTDAEKTPDDDLKEMDTMSAEAKENAGVSAEKTQEAHYTPRWTRKHEQEAAELNERYNDDYLDNVCASLD